jgi:hypothetical protein
MSLKRAALLLFMAAISGSISFGARTAIAASAPKPVETMPWIQLPGQADDLDVATDGTVFAVDSQGRVWLRPPGAEPSWRKLPGTFRRISVASNKLAWAVNGQGELYRYNGTWWRSSKARFPVKAMDVGVSGSGVAYAISIDGELFALDAKRGVLAMTGAPPKLQRVAVDERNQVWVVAGDERLHRFDGKRWSTFDSIRARDLGAGNGGLWVIGADDELLSLNPDGKLLRRVAAHAAAAVAVAPGGLPWIATADGHIYANNPDTGGNTAPAVVEHEQVFTQLINWQPVSGSARQLAISAKGAVLALGETGVVWQWKSRNNWGRLPGSFSRIALDNENTPWGIDSSGKILRFQGTFWTEQPDRARDIATGADGSVWILPLEGTPARWMASSREWQQLKTAPAGKTQRIAVTPDGMPWVINDDGKVLRYDGKRWIDLPSSEATSIGIGPEGTVFITTTDQRLQRWDSSGRRWEKLNGEAASVAVGPGGKPWVTTTAFRILASAFFDELPDSRVDTVSVAAASAAANTGSRVGSGTTASASVVGQPSAGGGPAQGRSDAPLQYRLLPGAARDIAIGADGSVYIVTFDGGLARWSNGRNAFISFEGQFMRIAVTPDGKPWGITTKGEVFRNDGTLWRLVRNIVAQDIAIAYNGTVMVADAQNTIQKYDPASGLFSRIPGDGDAPPPTGARLTLNPKGEPWTLDANGYVSRCDRSPCERLPARARDIGVGPEGSVIILDTSRILRRWNESAHEFQRMDSIADPVDALAVGPRGKPWLLSISSQVWASEFFPRDESRDGVEAAATAATSNAAQGTSTASPPVFTFLLNMPFDQVSLPAGFTSSTFPKPLMAISTNGSIVVLDSAFKFWNYNVSTKQFVMDGSPPSLSALLSGDDVRSFVIGKDGTYWVTNTGSQLSPAAYRRQGSQWVSVSGLSDCAVASCTNAAMTLAVGKDGTVYATSTGGKLYRYDTALKRFVALGLALPSGASRLDYVGVDPVGRLWAVSGASDKLYEYVGNAWIARNGGALSSSGACIDGTTVCFSIGANGSVYSDATVSGNRRLLRWNATSRTWDVINTSPNPGVYVVAPDGRPWVIQLSPAPTKLYKAR